jgi:hypothetical protein
MPQAHRSPYQDQLPILAFEECKSMRAAHSGSGGLAPGLVSANVPEGWTAAARSLTMTSPHSSRIYAV